MSRMSASGTPWTESSKCCNCASTFGLLRRRHHCRNCGRTVCSECSSGRVLMDGLLVRCCKDCAGRNSSFIDSPAPSKILQFQIKPSVESQVIDPLAGASINLRNTNSSPDSLRLKVNAPFLLGTELNLQDQESEVEDYITNGAKVHARLGEINEEIQDDVNTQSKVKDSTPPFPVASLSDDPPILEYGGWHPLSGTQEERAAAQKRFGLNLAAISPENMRRWYSGDSPWKAALVPPHGGVAFGVSYGGYRHGDDTFGVNDYAGRWRLSHLQVLEVGMGPATTNSISKPHFEFNRSGAHFIDRVDVPIFGKVSQSKWLVCAYASPNVRLVRCVSGFVDKEEEKFPFALSILRSLTIVDPVTNRKFTGGDGVRSEGKFSQNSYGSGRQGRAESAPVPPSPLSRPLSESEANRNQGMLRETSCLPNTPIEKCDRKMVIEMWSPSRGRLLMTLEHAPLKVKAPHTPGQTSRSISSTPSKSLLYGGDTLSSLVSKSMELLGLSQSSDLDKEDIIKQETLAQLKDTSPDSSQPKGSGLSNNPLSINNKTSDSLKSPHSLRDRSPPRAPLRISTLSTRCETSWESFLASSINQQVRLFNSQDKKNGEGFFQSKSDGISKKETKLDPLSASAVSKLPLCAFCGERIMLRALDALGHTWHPNCFTCIHCSRPLDQGERFYVDPETQAALVSSQGDNLVVRSTDNHSVHCYDCFIEVSYPRCFGCLAHIIDEPAVNAAGHSFHMKCFRCSSCSQNMIKGEGSEQKMVRYFDHNGLIYCESDFLRMFAETCRGCSFNLVKDSPGVVEAVGGLWHQECFVCAECGITLMAGQDQTMKQPSGVKGTKEGGWGVLGGVTYCSLHYETKLTIEESVLDDLSEEEEEAYALSSKLDSDQFPKSGASTTSHPASKQSKVEERKFSRYGVVVPPPSPPEASLSELINPTTNQFKENVIQHLEDNEETWLTSDSEAQEAHQATQRESAEQYPGNSEIAEVLRSSLVEDFYKETPVNDQSNSPVLSPIIPLHIVASGEQDSLKSDNADDEVKAVVHTGLRWARTTQSRAVHRGKFIREQIMKEMSTIETESGSDVDKDIEPASSLNISQALRFGVSALLGRDIPGGYQVTSNSVLKSNGRGTSELRGTSPSRRTLTPERGSTVHHQQHHHHHEVEEEATGPDSEPYFPEHHDYSAMTQLIIESSFEDSIEQKEEDNHTTSGFRYSTATASSNISNTSGNVAPNTVSFEAHAPAVFKTIRRKFFGMNDEAYFNCMCRTAISDITTGSGKSGSYFLYSHDKRLIIKSVRSSEFPFLVRILEAYVTHMEANHFHSLLPRFLGLYKVKLPRMPAERLLVMNNVFYAPLESRLPPIRKPPSSPITTQSSPTSSKVNQSASENAAENASGSETSSPVHVPLRRRLSISRAVSSARERLFGDGKPKKDKLIAVPTSHRSPFPPDVIAFLPPSPSTPNSEKNENPPSTPPPTPSSSLPTKTSINLCSESSSLSSESSRQTLRPVTMSQIYDLKGSLLKRFVSEEEQSRGERVLKDLNFCGYHRGTDNKGNPIERRGLKCRKLRVGKERWASLSAALMSDVEWLRAHNIMDYSLLVGVGMVKNRTSTPTKATDSPEEEVQWSHLSPSCYSEWVRDTGGLRARDQAEEEKSIVYYLGIIDILQEFNMGKRMESAYKQRLQIMAGKDPGLISAVDASVYGKRFLEFMTDHIE